MSKNAKINKKLKILKLLALKYKYLHMFKIKSSLKSKINKKKKKRFWIRNYLKERKLHGAFHVLIPQLRSLNPGEQVPEAFLNYFRITPECFDILAEKVRPFIEKDESGREPISVEEQLAVTLRYLSSGNSMNSIAYEFRLGSSTVSHIVARTIKALWVALKPEVFPQIYTEEFWKSIANDFQNSWNFPNCIGALDGKHCTIQAFAKQGSTNFNYHGNHSVVLMGICDAFYKFIHIDVGAAGRHSDGGVFKSSQFGIALADNQSEMNLPSETSLPNSDKRCPYVIVGDEAFPLLKHLMRPYPGRGGVERMEEKKAIFNFRLSRCRRTIENTFGIYSSRFRIFRKPIHAKSSTVNYIVKAAAALHNFLIINYPSSYIPPGSTDTEQNPGTWRDIVQRDTGLIPISGSSATNTPTVDGTAVRNLYTDYFMNEGSVPWQSNRIHNFCPSNLH